MEKSNTYLAENVIKKDMGDAKANDTVKVTADVAAKVTADVAEKVTADAANDSGRMAGGKESVPEIKDIISVNLITKYLIARLNEIYICRIKHL